MRIREYNQEKDFYYLRNWIQDQRTHALWCWNRCEYPITEDGFLTMLVEIERQSGEKSYICEDDKELPIGFFLYAKHDDDQKGYLKCILVDNQQRGKGYGTKMLTTLIQKAKEEGAVAVRLGAFDCNERAKRCYEKVGFVAYDFNEKALQYEQETWGWYPMEINI